MILVTGGTGFVGRHLVARLVESGQQVRVLARTKIEIPGTQSFTGDVRDLSAVVAAARDCQAVVHLVGIIRESRGASFAQTHIAGTRTVIRACQEAGVGRLLHISALGARPDPPSRYQRTKWEAEELVRASGLAATIFRPSVLFGTGGSFLPELRKLLHSGPVIPIVGDGMALLQPVWVEDVVSCLMGALAQPDTPGQAYELGGPEVFGFAELVDLLAQQEGISKPKLHLPVLLMRPLAAVLGRFSAFPLTADQLAMLLEDNVCDISAMRETFGLEPAPLRNHLGD
jgi:uncharacterized protein YbjT (DUF2867 family)